MKKIDLDSVIETNGLSAQLSDNLTENVKKMIEVGESVELNLIDGNGRSLYTEITRDDEDSITYIEDYFDADGEEYEDERDYDTAPLGTKLIIFNFLVKKTTK